MARTGRFPRPKTRRAKIRFRIVSRREHQSNGHTLSIRLGVAFIVLLLVALITTSGSGVAMYLSATSGHSSPEDILGGTGTKVFDRNGQLLFEYTNESGGVRRSVSLDEISPYLVQATICTEDPTFYSNPGLSLKGLGRAVAENVFPEEGERFQGSGGSSITQQLAKITFIQEDERFERSLTRKIREAMLAVDMTRRYSKDQIIEWYLNRVFYGSNAYGVGAATLRYFNKTPAELNLAEAALLAGIPQSPSLYDPYANPAAAKDRQRDVLSLMVEHGCISQPEADQALVTDIQLVPQSFPVEAPHFVFSYLQPLLENWFGKDTVYRAGLQVTTTLDLDFQKQVESIMEEEIAPREQSCNCHNGAVVVLNPKTGEILAYVGSRGYWNESIEGKVDNLQAIKQPGSSFKPIVYLSYFMSQHAGPGSLIWDSPYKKTYDFGSGAEEFEIVDPHPIPHGPVSARVALASSLNIPAVRVAEAAGAEEIIRTANKLGYTTMTQEDVKEGHYGPSIATGGANLTMFEHAFAFATLANNGEMRGQKAVRNYGDGMRKIDPTSVLQVTTNAGVVLESFKEPVKEQVVPANYAYLVTSSISDCDSRYLTWTCSYFDIGRPYAVKTGTQQGFTKDKQGRDTTLYNWQIGYTPDLVVGVWIGNQNNEPVSNLGYEAAEIANLIWKRVMRAGLKGVVARQFEQPAGVEKAPAIAGRPGAFSCDATITEVWAKGDQKPVLEQCRQTMVSRPPDALLPPSPTPKAAATVVRTATATATPSATATPTEQAGAPTATPIPPASTSVAPSTQAPAVVATATARTGGAPTPIPTTVRPSTQPQPTVPAPASNAVPPGNQALNPVSPNPPR